MNEKSLNFRIPLDLYNLIKQEASKKNISMASMVRIALSEYFEKK